MKTLLFSLLLFQATPFNWQPLYHSADIVLNYRFENCEAQPYLFIELKNLANQKVEANFDIFVKDKAGNVLFTFTDWYVDVEPGTYTNKCQEINDNQLAILLPKQFENALVEVVRKP